MKKLVFFAILALCLASCAATKSTAQKKAEQTRMESAIEDSIQARSLMVTFDYVNPMGFPPHYLTTEYSIRINGDSISSYLPYFGRAYSSDYGSTESPLAFEGHITQFSITKGRKHDYTIIIETRKGQELLVYTLTIFNNGKTSLAVTSNSREPINFDGEVRL